MGSFFCSVFGTVVVAATPNLVPPTSPLYWTLIVGGAALAAFPPAYIGWREARNRLRQREQQGRRIPRFLRWLAKKRVAVAIAVALTVVLAIGVPPVVELVRGVGIRLYGCPSATQLRVVANPETLVTARQLAGAYERGTADENYGCPAVDVYVYLGMSDEIRERARTGDGWSDESGALREIGPRPDVWLAATGHELAGLDAAVADSTPVAFSPVVLAVPSGRAELGAPASADSDRRPLWAELFTRVTDQGVRVVRADPGSTELALLATALLYGQDGPASPEQLAPAEVERRIAESLDEGGFPLTDALGLLCRHRLLESQAAVIASEQHVVRYNLGDPLGESCPFRAGEPGRLVALYPSDSRHLDHQFVRFSWSEPPQEEAAAAFGAWLRSDAGRHAILATGLRPPSPYPVGGALTTPGIDPTALPVTEPIRPERWDATAAAYDGAQRRGRVLFALDTSGSMAAAAPGGPRSAVAADAIFDALQRMGPRDQFGLWFFPDAAGAGSVEALPIGPSNPDRLASARQSLDGAQPAGNTPLYRTAVDAAAALDPDDPAQVDAVVVVTDGEDTSSGLGADAVGAALAGSGVRLIVVTIGELACADTGLLAVTTATAGECINAEPADLDTSLAAATAGLWGGR